MPLSDTHKKIKKGESIHRLDRGFQDQQKLKEATLEKDDGVTYP